MRHFDRLGIAQFVKQGRLHGVVKEYSLSDGHMEDINLVEGAAPSLAAGGAAFGAFSTKPDPFRLDSRLSVH